MIQITELGWGWIGYLKTWQLSDLVTNSKDWNWIWKGNFFVDLEMFTHRDFHFVRIYSYFSHLYT